MLSIHIRTVATAINAHCAFEGWPARRLLDVDISPDLSRSLEDTRGAVFGDATPLYPKRDSTREDDLLLDDAAMLQVERV